MASYPSGSKGWNSNYAYTPLKQRPTGSQTNFDDLEEENERSAEQLKEKIGALKSLTIDIGNEVRYQDKLIRGLDDDIDRTSGFLGNTMAKVIRIGKNSGGKIWLWMFLFILFVAFIFWLMLKFR